MTKLIVAFRKFTKAAKNEQFWNNFCLTLDYVNEKKTSEPDCYMEGKL
jgi:hypothetical protein